MKSNNIFLPLVSLSILLCSSCATKNHLPYFTNLPTLNDTVVVNVESNYALKIVPDDELLITVTSLEPSASAMFNLPMANVATRGIQEVTGNVALQTYIVSSDGDIHFPQLGTLHVGGMTTKEVTEMLTERISKYVESPMVRVEIVNFNINVLGEVNKPGQFPIPKESLSILDAIALAGDLTEYGQRDNVLLIRREGDKTIYHRFNLNDAKSLNTPYFYLKQNDVVYVEPTKTKDSNAKYNTNNSFKLSVISTIVSAVSVIASLAIALSK